jgi:MFS family permease
MVEQLKAGWAYVRGFRPIRTILLLFALISLMGMPFMVLMPIFAAKVLHGGPHTLGFLLGASGVGALISAVSLALRKTVRGLTTMIQISAALFGVGLICFGLSRVLPLSLFLMLIVGFGMMQGLAASNTVIQTLVTEDMRGRVMSYYTMAFVGMAPFGSLLAGGLAHKLGAPNAVMITGAFCLAGSVWFTTQLKSIRRIMRPIYIEMGIIRSELEPAMEDQVGR